MDDLPHNHLVANQQVEELARTLRNDESDTLRQHNDVVTRAVGQAGLAAIEWVNGEAVVYDLVGLTPGTSKITVSYHHRSDDDRDILRVRAVRGEDDAASVYTTEVGADDLRHAVAAAQLDCRNRPGIDFTERPSSFGRNQTAAEHLVEAIRAVVREDDEQR